MRIRPEEIHHDVFFTLLRLGWDVPSAVERLDRPEGGMRTLAIEANTTQTSVHAHDAVSDYSHQGERVEQFPERILHLSGFLRIFVFPRDLGME